MEAIVDDPVLVLNANFEPLNICTTRRAVGLMMTGKAEMLVNGRGVIKSASSVFPRPSIVRLSYMVHRPRPRVKLSKREIFRRDNFTCQYCGTRTGGLTIDHVVPRHRGGQHSWTNLVAACPACNRRKGGRTPMEAQMPLRKQPKEPTASAEYLYGQMAKTHIEWDDYINGW
jgi:5-methylcytosine-specific restriction endonuclease McrA